MVDFEGIAAMCGWHNLPMVFVSGDQATIEETQRLVPNVEYVVTKIAFGPSAAKTRAPAKARELIHQGTERALRRVREIEPLSMKPPFAIGEGDAQIRGDNLQELYDKFVDPNGRFLGNQDIEPERGRIQAKRKEWARERSFLASG